MFNTVARLGVAYVLTNIESQALPVSLARSLAELREMGQRDIIIDPGFGFGKTLEDNYRVLMQLEAYRELQLPILVGVSRKRMVYEPLEITAEEALTGTTALHALALERGANILRVHDVKPAVEVIKILKQCSLHSA
jgi:dihydropteroate synthase